jgi:sulfur-oxidizing protein SoxX
MRPGVKLTARLPVLALGIVMVSMPLAGLAQSPAGAAPVLLQSIDIVGDAVPQALGSSRGDAVRGRAIVANRQVGLCLLCHTGPFPEERFQGNLAPSLAGAGGRLSEGQLRLRLIDARRINPASIMPAYYRIDGLNRVAPALQGQPLLSAGQIEDVVAFLITLK